MHRFAAPRAAGYEREADRLAARAAAAAPRRGWPRRHETSSSAGHPLDSQTRAFMEERLGHDFSKVRIHDDATSATAAERMNALAYTDGHDIVFARNAYDPATNDGRQLIAHELVHTVQQESAGRMVQCKDPDPAVEAAALQALGD